MRVIFISTVKNRLLKIEERKSSSSHSVPFKDIAAVICNTPQITLTQNVISSLAEAGGIFVTTDSKHLPLAMTLPVATNTYQSERMNSQAELKKTVKKRLWQQIIKVKIINQAKILELLKGNDFGLKKIAEKVRSADSANAEAHAGKVYFKALQFFERRDRHAEDNNILLNYGYSVLHAAAARALCGSGLHPSLGINHHSRYNQFCLASDIMEPLRPLIDYAAAEVIAESGDSVVLDKKTKAALLKPLIRGRVNIDNKKSEVFFALTKTAKSYVDVCSGKRDNLLLPSV